MPPLTPSPSTKPKKRAVKAAPKSRTRPVIPVGWFLREWMDTLKVDQATMVREAGWSKTTASHLYNCQQDYNPDLVRAAAHALKLNAYELLMHPDEAFHIRRLRNAVEQEHQLRLAAERKAAVAPDAQDDGEGHRAVS